MAEFQEVMRQLGRLCKAQKSCVECTIHDEKGQIHCRNRLVREPSRMEEIIMKWAAEHPEKTMKDVLLEKFPKAMLRADGMPCACVAYLGLGKCIDNCAKHWRSPAPEE